MPKLFGFRMGKLICHSPVVLDIVDVADAWKANGFPCVVDEASGGNPVLGVSLPAFCPPGPVDAIVTPNVKFGTVAIWAGG